jgi:hypothetical protein
MCIGGWAGMVDAGAEGWGYRSPVTIEFVGGGG